MLVQIDGSAQLALAICNEFTDYRKSLRIKGKAVSYSTGIAEVIQPSLLIKGKLTPAQEKPNLKTRADLRRHNCRMYRLRVLLSPQLDWCRL